MWQDAAGTRHARAAEDARIVSLVPSLTELLLVLGLRDRVVGRTGFCIHPRDAVAGIPKVGGTKDVRIDRVRALAPTHLIVNIDENDRPVVDALGAVVPHVIVTHPLAPEDNLALYELFGGVFGRSEAAAVLAAKLQDELEACRAGTWRAERVLYLIWKKPWMTVAADTYIARSLAQVGWEVLHGPGGWAGAQRYPVIEDLDPAVARADRVLLSSEPYRFRSRDLEALRARFPGKSIEPIDGEMTSWYGARAIAGLRYLRTYRGAGDAHAMR
ncbi:MAG: ABC transporter substrate-binding protein [Planctomycetes bacterium]|nr:ABC transporter substrate-binding protein [Planctomycetota bacterium]